MRTKAVIGLSAAGLVAGAGYVGSEFYQGLTKPNLVDLPEQSLDPNITQAGIGMVCLDNYTPETCTPENAPVTFTTGGNNILLSYDELPQDLIDAFRATEHREFWEDTDGKVSNLQLLNCVREGRGCSTIPWQLARHLYRDDDPGSEEECEIDVLGYSVPVKLPADKCWERDVGYTLVQTYSKEDLMTSYANIIPYGRNAYGVQMASLMYFGRTVDQTSLLEQAMLAGLPQNPQGYDGSDVGDPVEDQEQTDARSRRTREVLNNMIEILNEERPDPDTDPEAWNAYVERHNEITAARDDLDAGKLQVLPYQEPDESVHANYNVADQLGMRHYLDKVLVQAREELGSTDGDNRVFIGHKVMTTIDYWAQAAVKQSVDEMHATQIPNDGRQLAVVMLRRDGSTAAYYGGDYSQSQVDLASAYSPTGSGIKLDGVLSTAKEAGLIDRDTVFTDPGTYTWPGANNGEDWTITGGNHCADLQLPPEEMDYRCISARSSNPEFMRLAQQLGPQAIEDTLAALGAPRRPDQPVAPADVFGAGERTLTGIANSRASLYARRGEFLPDYKIHSIYEMDGKDYETVYEYETPDAVQVFDDPDTAIFTLEAALEVTREEYKGTARNAFSGFPAPFAGKTGTEEAGEESSEYSDSSILAMFAGVTAIDSSKQPENQLEITIDGPYAIAVNERFVEGLGRPINDQGGGAPAHTARRIADKMLALPGVEPAGL